MFIIQRQYKVLVLFNKEIQEIHLASSLLLSNSIFSYQQKCKMREYENNPALLSIPHHINIFWDSIFNAPAVSLVRDLVFLEALRHGDLPRPGVDREELRARPAEGVPDARGAEGAAVAVAGLYREKGYCWSFRLKKERFRLTVITATSSPGFAPSETTAV